MNFQLIVNEVQAAANQIYNLTNQFFLLSIIYHLHLHTFIKFCYFSLIINLQLVNFCQTNIID